MEMQKFILKQEALLEADAIKKNLSLKEQEAFDMGATWLGGIMRLLLLVEARRSHEKPVRDVEVSPE